MTNEELERRVAALEHGHSLTRWYTGRVDRDLAEIAATQTEHTGRLDRIEATLATHTVTLVAHTATLAEHTDRLDRIEATLTEHTSRFDSVDSQMRSLTQLVGQVLKRLPEPDED